MEGKGTLTGLTLKDKLEGQFIEVKIMARYEPELLAGLGGFFGKPLGFQIDSPQPDLEFEGEEDGSAVLDLEREIERRR